MPVKLQLALLIIDDDSCDKLFVMEISLVLPAIIPPIITFFTLQLKSLMSCLAIDLLLVMFPIIWLGSILNAKLKGSFL